MEYQIVREKKAQLLETKVSEMMADGWQPTGGVLVLDSKSEDSKRTFCQALMKSS